MILLAGCSFMFQIQAIDTITDDLRKHGRTIFHASCGSGNESISASVVDEIMKRKSELEYVLVLWSGIDRLDLELNTDDIEYDWKHNNFLHSGGVLGSWQGLDNKNIRDYMNYYYKYSDSKINTQRTVRSIFAAKCALEAYNIPYDFGMIYNPYDKKTSQDEATLGLATRNFDEYLTIPTYPLNWCKERNLLSDDKFHPTTEGFIQWIDSLNLKVHAHEI